MIFGIGTDIVEVERFEKAIQRHGEPFLLRLFTEAERLYCSSHRFPSLHYAARFAAKEALFKAIGQGLRGSLRWQDAEVCHDALGKPYFVLWGYLHELLLETTVHLTMSHSDNYAVATVVVENEGKRVVVK